ncbi:MAG: hypothetical protein OXE85_02880, partial [Roseovarius sp.]|nr:hypothetical protein [Roseovarius sp.]
MDSRGGNTMKRTTLRTSAIALGVAVAMPATAQEWNLKWAGFMNQHVVFGSTDKKTTVNLNDLSYTFDGDETPATLRTGNDIYTATVHFIAEVGDVDDLPDDAERLFETAIPSGGLDWSDPAAFKTTIQTAVN